MPGTEVFVAEMGTYGPGEIAELCEWIEPAIGVITAIGPVHLERFGSEDRIVEAKAEIFAKAEVAVLNVDDDRLRALADRLEGEGKRVIRCSGRRRGASMLRRAWTRRARATWPRAVAVALELASCRPRTSRSWSKTAAHRRQPAWPAPPAGATAGWTILDDTFNSNPAGAARALDALEAAPARASAASS